MAHTQPALTAAYGSNTITRLTEYRMEMLSALDAETLPGLVDMGIKLTSSALDEKWPIASGDLAYAEIVAGIPNLVQFGTIFLSLTTKEYGTGVIETADRLRSVEWLRYGWGTAPQKNARAWMRVMEEAVATAIEEGDATSSFEGSGKYIFDTSKPSDPASPNSSNTYTNLHTSTALSVDNILAMRTSFRTQKGPTGKPRGYRLSHILVGADKEDELLAYLKDDAIIKLSGSSSTETATMVPNRLKHYAPIEPIICDYLTDSGAWYPIAAEEAGPAMPWMTLLKTYPSNGAAPGMPAPAFQAADGLEWITLDENSDHYKVGSNLGKAGTLAQWSKGRVGAAVVAPWRIKRCTP
jgi:hypothetical protein